MRRALPLLLALLLVLAGCSATQVQPPSAETAEPTPTVAETSTPTPAGTETASPSTPTEQDPATLAAQYDVAVEGGNLSVDPALVFARVELIIGTRAKPPERVLIRPDEEMAFDGPGYPTFYRLFGIRIPDDEDRSVTAAGYVRDPDTVNLNERLTNNSTATESVLAHESVHVVQFRTGLAQGVSAAVVDREVRGVTTDAKQTYFAVIEGTAVQVERVYVRRYLEDGSDPAAGLAAGYRGADGAAKLAYARYRFGFAYVDQRAGGPREHGEIYDDPPRTSEEVLHNLPPGSEEPSNLSVANAGEWEERQGFRDRMGELWLRVVLANELNESTAAAGADGWGADEKRGYERDGERGYAWVLRWDDAANGTEFQEVFAQYLDERATRRGEFWVDRDALGGEGATFDLVRVDDRTVVVLAGDSAFVEDAELRTHNGTVVVDA